MAATKQHPAPWVNTMALTRGQMYTREHQFGEHARQPNDLCPLCKKEKNV